MRPYKEEYLNSLHNTCNRAVQTQIIVGVLFSIMEAFATDEFIQGPSTTDPTYDPYAIINSTQI